MNPKCVKGAETMFVEVKGTTGDGSTVLLTAGEVKFALRHRSSMALFLVHSIRLGDEETHAKGTPIVKQPWRIQNQRLSPTRYVYEV